MEVGEVGTIIGVNSMKVNTLKSFRVGLDSQYTNGHDFCELIIDEENYNFTARLYGGEVYTYGWTSPGDDFIKFLINVLKANDGYLYTKLADHTVSNYVDMEKSVDKMVTQLIKSRRQEDISEEDARDAYDELQDLRGYENVSMEYYQQLYITYINEEVREEVFGGRNSWDADCHVEKTDWKVEVFCRKVAPILADVLKNYYYPKPE